MKLYTYSAARQRLAEVLEEATREGEVQIRRQDGRIYAVTPVAASLQSPFARVIGGPVSRVTSRELLRLAREEGQARGGRVLRSARSGRVPRARKRSRQ
jgi:antitoxin Phd